MIFFGREPSYIESHSYEGENLYLSFHHDKNETWLPQTWWLDMSYDELKNLKYPKLKIDIKEISSALSSPIIFKTHKFLK